jgi:hypothetical protein
MCYCDLHLLPTIHCFSVGKISVAQDGVKKSIRVGNFVLKMVLRNLLGLIILHLRWLWRNPLGLVILCSRWFQQIHSRFDIICQR